MARKAGLTTDEVVAAAAAIADEEGLNAVTLTKVASALGVRAPSLYTHVDGLSGLRRAIALRAGQDLAAALEGAAQDRRGVDALRAMAHTYRRFATEHPGLYSSLLPAPDEKDEPEAFAAMAASVAVAAGALAQVGVPAPEAVAVIRSFRSGLHGFVTLEAGGGFGLPDDVEASFEILVDLLVAGTLGRGRSGASSTLG